MLSRISKLLNASNGHSDYSSGELQLLQDYFCEPSTDSCSSADDGESDREIAGDIANIPDIDKHIEPVFKRAKSTASSQLITPVPAAASSQSSASYASSQSASLITPVPAAASIQSSASSTSTSQTVSLITPVPDAVSSQSSTSTVTLHSGEKLAADELSVEIHEFKCGCQLGPKNRPCHETLNFAQILQQKLSCLELDYYNADSINYLNEHIIAKIDALCSDSDKTQKGHGKNGDRMRVKCKFVFHGHKVCQATFLFLHNIGKKRWKNLMKRWQNSGVELHTHGNRGKGNKNQLMAKDVTDIVTFIDNLASTHAMILPGRVPAFKDPDLKLLPSGLPESKVHRSFVEAAQKSDVRVISYRTFCRVWKQYRPNIRVQNPRTDLCSVCTANQLNLGTMSNLSEEDQLKLLRASSDHLVHANKERVEYKRQITESRTNFDPNLKVGYHEPCSFDGFVHYSFDYAQQVHIPSSAEQVGTLYFLTPYKVALFGVQCDTVSKQINYLIPESAVTGKGANQVVSYLHDFLLNHSLGEKHAFFHGDNCCAQNKNNILMGYFLWRVMNDLHHSITMSFLPVGHTKFSPDPAFGVFKSKFRRSDVNNLTELAKVVEDSTPDSKLNQAKLVGDVAGNVLVPTYDWQQHFRDLLFSNIPNIKSDHKFIFSKEFKGRVRLYESSYSTVYTEFAISSDSFTDDLPPVVAPIGLSAQRQLYLYKCIRQFVAEESKDILCPNPVEQACFKEPLPNLSTMQPAKVPETLETHVRAAPKCGFCGQTGHRNSVIRGRFTCPERKE
jgi:hypothetical protein